MTLRIFFLFCCAQLILFSCVNDLEKIKKITFKSTDPDEKTRNLFLTYSDSGVAQIRLYAPIAESFNEGSKKVMFNEGVRVEFYQPNGKLGSILTALYGEIDEQKGMMLVRDSVHLYNPAKDERLETEALFWNRKDSLVYTDRFVTIRSKKALLFGKGIKTKQDFSSYEFIQPQGKLLIEE